MAAMMLAEEGMPEWSGEEVDAKELEEYFQFLASLHQQDPPEGN